MKEIALKYLLEKKWSLLPCGKDKVPLTEWEQWQKKLPTEAEVEFWFKFHKDPQIGIICGRISGLAVIDVEFEGIGKTPQLPSTFTVRTGGGGYHYYYKWQEGIGNRARVMPFLDVRGEGGYVVAPPSETTKGKYEVVEDLPLADFPMWILGTKKAYTEWEEVSEGMPDGQRNQMSTVVIGKLMRAVPPEDWRKVVWPYMQYWNSKCDPPMPEWELKTTYSSIANRASQNNWNLSEEESKIVYAEDKWKEIIEKNKDIPKFTAKTGIPTLDELVGGFRKGWLVIVSAPPKHGKTAFCQTLTKHFVSNGIRCCWFSYELPYEELFEKMPMDKMDFYLPNEMDSGDIGWIRRKIDESVGKFGTEIVIIDQLDFLEDPKISKMPNVNYPAYIGGIIKQIKDIARTKKIIIILMAQIIKAEWTSPDLPTSQDIAETRKIVALSDIILMLMRRRKKRKLEIEDIYDGNRAILGIIENRHNGKTKKINILLKDKEFVEEFNYKQEKTNEEAW